MASTLTRAFCLCLFILLVFLFFASATGMLIQASRTSRPPGLKGNWNSLILGLAYICLTLISLGYYIARTITSRKKMARISILSPKLDNMASSAQKYAQIEYYRACAISYASLPHATAREGWGSPGTPLEGIRFRRALLDTVLPIDALARQVIPHLPQLNKRNPLLNHLNPLLRLMPTEDHGGSTCLHSYAAAIEIARHNVEEPIEAQFIKGMRAAGRLSRILDEYISDRLENLKESYEQQT